MLDKAVLMAKNIASRRILLPIHDRIAEYADLASVNY